MKTAAFAVAGILAVVLAKGVGSIVGRSTVNQFSSGYDQSARETALTTGIAKAVAQIHSQAPIHVDKVTTLRDAMAAGKEIIYLMELEADLSSAQIAQTKVILEKQNAKNVCSNEATKSLVKMGGVMTWQYTVKSEDAFRVSVSNCS